MTRPQADGRVVQAPPSAPGVPAAPGAPAATGSKAQRLADLITTVQGNLLSIGVGNAIIASGLAAALHGATAPTVLLPWLALQLLHSGFSVWSWWRTRRRPTLARHAQRRARASEWGALASSLLWALPLPWLWPEGRLDLQMLILMVLTGLTSGAIHSLSAHVRAFHLFMVPIVTVVCGICVWHGVPGGPGAAVYLLIALTSVVYGFTSLRFAAAMHAVQLRSLEQRDALAELAADLQHQKDRAEQISHSRSRFLAAASHDIRQPVHTLGLFLAAFDDQALSGTNAALIGPLRASARGLREMLDSILDLSRADAGVLQAEIAPLPLQRLLDTLERDFAPLAEGKGLVLRTVPTAAWVLADAQLLERVARNLVSNAVRYTAHGGVLIGVRHRAAAGAAAHWVLEVWDTGPGISSADQARIFDEFARGSQAGAGAATEGRFAVEQSPAATGEPQGLGLGLAIARRFAQAMGAFLSADSRLGRGTVFRLQLVAASGAAAVPTPDEPDRPALAMPLLAGLQVLLIDDDPGVRQATTVLLRHWGCHVLALQSPDELAHVHPLRPHVVVSDNRFADRLRAHEVLQWWLAQGGAAGTLLVLTGDTKAENLLALATQGVTVLGKPLETARLQRALHGVLALPRADAGGRA